MSTAVLTKSKSTSKISNSEQKTNKWHSNKFKVNSSKKLLRVNKINSKSRSKVRLSSTTSKRWSTS